MGISRFNSEGYCDPTAYEAIKKAETFRIVHPTGYLDINTEKFFPCTVEKGKKTFRLVREHCSKAQQEELLGALLRKEKRYALRALKLERSLDDTELTRSEHESIHSQLMNIARQQERIARNIEQFKEVMAK